MLARVNIMYNPFSPGSLAVIWPFPEGSLYSVFSLFSSYPATVLDMTVTMDAISLESVLTTGNPRGSVLIERKKVRREGRKEGHPVF